MKSIPYGRHSLTEEDIAAVVEVLRSDYLTQGPRIKEFEESFAKYVGSKYAVAVANGTGALHLSTIAIGLKPGQKVITTPITFAASANCIRYCGGEVTFADISKDTYLIDIEAVKTLLESSPKGTYSGIIPVDFGGRAVNLESLKALAQEHGLWIIEDACHAPGGYFLDSNNIKQKCGNGNLADLAIFSLHPVKHIAAGEGGVITTNNVSLYNKLLMLRTHGITRDHNSFLNDARFASANESQGNRYPAWYMEMQLLGYNYRLTDFQAALANSQLSRADQGLIRRGEIANRYQEAFANKSFIKGQSGNVEGHAYHLYVIEVERRFELYNFLAENHVLAQIHYVPTHLMPYYRQLGWKEGDLPNSDEYYKHCISLPMFPTLTLDEQMHVINMILTFYEGK